MEAEKVKALLEEAVTDAEVHNYAEKNNAISGNPVSDSLVRCRFRVARKVCGEQIASAIPLPILLVGSENHPTECPVVPDKTGSNTSKLPTV